jgi:uroporphyrinogen decarboxylase
MTSREIVRAAITFDGPERVPMSLPPPYPNDFRTAYAGPDPACPASGWHEVEPGRWEETDEWGNTWARVEGFSKGEVARGALERWDALDALRLPDYGLPERYAEARRVFGEETERFRVGGLPGFPFNIARKMRRLDNFLVDVLAEPDRVAGLLAMVEEQMARAVRQYAAAGADAVMFPEDWGTQDRLLVRPEVWRRVFRPGFERLCGIARDCGLFVLMHSCGCIREIIDDLIGVGINVLQFDQPRLYGIEALAEQFGGRAAFWCPVDIQTTLQSGDAAAIRAEARLMVERLGAFRGGFIAGYYWGNEAIGLDRGWQDVACRAFVEHGAPEVWRELEPRLAAGGAPAGSGARSGEHRVGGSD